MPKKVGLALGSGAARGLAHVGVLEVLEREGIPIDMIAGTSIGSVVGALYASGHNVAHLKEIAKKLDMRTMASLIDPALPWTGLIGGKRVEHWLGLIIGKDLMFNDLQIPFACVATDIYACGELVLDEGSVLEAVRASMSIPGIFAVAKWKGRFLVDGALTNPVPVSVLKKMGADFIIAVDVSPDEIFRVPTSGRAKKPSVFSLMIQMVQIASCSLSRAAMVDADVIIHPHVGHILASDFLRTGETILEGELAAQDSIPEIKRKLASLSGGYEEGDISNLRI